MIFRIYPTKDTFITNQRVDGLIATGSNVGASEVLEVFKSIPSSGTVGLGRILTSFDLGQFSGIVPTSGTVKYFLRMKDLQHAQTLPSSFDLEISPLTQDWDEGNGVDVDNFFDVGYANWMNAKSTVPWTVSGAVGGTPTASFHFDTGHEDLRADVTSIVVAWNSGTMPNNGFMVKLTGSQETNSLQYFVKMFSGRETFFGNWRPYLEAIWDDTIQTGSVVLASGEGPFFMSVRNLRNQYEGDEVVKMRVFARNWDYNPAVVLTASSGPNGIVFDKAYYRIKNDRTDEVVVPFGTGSIAYTKLSYDVSGSYFVFWMPTLPPQEVYRLSFLLDVAGTKQIVDQGFKFRVV